MKGAAFSFHKWLQDSPPLLNNILAKSMTYPVDLGQVYRLSEGRGEAYGVFPLFGERNH